MRLSTRILLVASVLLFCVASARDDTIRKMIDMNIDPGEAAVLYEHLARNSLEDQDLIIKLYKNLRDIGADVKEARIGAFLVFADVLAERKDRDAKRANEDFLGIDWGLGVSASFDSGSKTRVKSARATDRIVRVTEEGDVSLGVVLESHRFFKLKPRGEDEIATLGLGPFLAIQPSGDEVIDSWAIGIMLGLRAKNAANSWNIGIGWRTELDVQMLGDGLVANEPLPDGENEVRFKTDDIEGIVVVFSTTF